ncbi:MAG: thioredoxin [Candidatus Aminicenantes bacterium RBG_19FT_COMBO_59_29]|nr:MAG: thioredoxin [Candidatus Aminicenantes bacterium RBG_19FT_COMBO_59_29]HCS47671.1 thioredoxin [Candidatus Aminicenantes bacterium]
MSTDIHSVTDADFEEEVLKSPLPVLIDFWAAWCVPCRMITPTVEQIAESHNEKLKVAKMNVDENMKTPGKYGIRGIPTLLLFKGGELKETMVGVQSKDKIIEIISKHL